MISGRADRWKGRSALKVYELHYGPNMTPMVDVVMVILIFFMASAAIMGPEWFIRTALPAPTPPQAAAINPPPDTPGLRLRVELTREGTQTRATLVRADAAATEAQRAPRAVGLVDLSRTIQELVGAAPAEAVVLIKAGPEVPYADVVAAHEACQRLGVTRVGLAP
ncbi:MAG: biopolymer transporter ExbD [Planctomycetota bacterium]|nr:biopolymer transporter ExbD [Planctomycetota bacterium]